MNDMTNSIIKGIINACSMSNDYTIEVGKEYKKDPLLQYFPVPYVQPTNIDLDLKFAINDNGCSEQFTPIEDLFSQETCSNLCELLQTFYINRIPKDLSPQQSAQIKGSIDVQINGQTLAIPYPEKRDNDIISSNIIGSSKDMMLDISNILNIKNIGYQMISDQGSENQTQWSQLQTNTTSIVSQDPFTPEQPDSTDQPIEYIFDSSRLANIEPSKINNMKISLAVGTKQWVKLQDKEGHTYEKLD